MGPVRSKRRLVACIRLQKTANGLVTLERQQLGRKAAQIVTHNGQLFGELLKVQLQEAVVGFEQGKRDFGHGAFSGSGWLWITHRMVRQNTQYAISGSGDYRILHMHSLATVALNKRLF